MFKKVLAVIIIKLVLLVLLMLHSCHIRVARVILAWPVSGTRVVKQVSGAA